MFVAGRAAVHVGGVEEGDARGERRVDYCKGLGAVGASAFYYY